jgi:GDP-D-mannose 3', 5'-epimerase
MANQRILVAGAGGFIGHHVVRRLKRDGNWVRGADSKKPRYEDTPADEFELLDLRRSDDCLRATRGIDQVYNLAADVGGRGYIGARRAKIAHNNTLIAINMLEASRLNGVRRYLYPSSACVYPQSIMNRADATPLKEESAFPADPEPGYGWEKLYAEQLCSYYHHDYGFETRIVRLTNIYGPLSTFEGGKERVSAAICRQVALLNDGDEIEVWGDGQQSQSFLYIDDCVEGLVGLMASDYPHPLNLGTDQLVTIDELVDLVSALAGKRLIKRHDLTKPLSVRSRSTDNSRLLEIFKWRPSVGLEEGLSLTYRWIENELRKAGRISKARFGTAAD